MNNINTKSGYIESFTESSLDQDECGYSEKNISTKSNIFAIIHKYKLWDKSPTYKSIRDESGIDYGIVSKSTYNNMINMELKSKK